LQQRGFKETPSHTLFYPEFKDKVESKVVGNALDGGIFGALFLQLPFYDAVVVPVMALASEAAFKETYKLSVDELLHLEQKGNVLLALDSPPELYAGLDYLDPILERRPPSIQVRNVGYDNYVSIFTQDITTHQVIAHPEISVPACMIFWDQRVRSLPWIESFERTEAKAVVPSKSWIELATKAGISLTTTVYQLASWHYDLVRAGYGQLVQQLCHSHLPTEAEVAGLFTMRNHLQTFPSFAMDGVLTSDETIWPWSFYETHGIKGPQYTVFPVDIAKQLEQSFKLMDIRPLGWGRAIDIAADTAMARRALFELQDAVNKENVNSLADRANAVAKKIQEANLAVESMAETKGRVQKYLPMVLGVLGGAAAGLALPTLVAGMFGGFVSSLPLTDRVGSILAKRGKPGYIVALYDLRKSLTQS
jgi:hypothetical protein